MDCFPSWHSKAAVVAPSHLLNRLRFSRFVKLSLCGKASPFCTLLDTFLWTRPSVSISFFKCKVDLNKGHRCGSEQVTTHLVQMTRFCYYLIFSSRDITFIWNRFEERACHLYPSCCYNHILSNLYLCSFDISQMQVHTLTQLALLNFVL